MITHETTKKIVHTLCTHATHNWLFCNCTYHFMKIKTRSQTTKHCIVFSFQQYFFVASFSGTQHITFLCMICVRTIYTYIYAFFTIHYHCCPFCACYVLCTFPCLFWSLQQYIFSLSCLWKKPMKGLKICYMLCCVKRCVILFYVAIKYSRSRIYSNVGYYYV